MDKLFFLDLREEPGVFDKANSGNLIAILLTLAMLALAIILFIYFKKKKKPLT